MSGRKRMANRCFRCRMHPEWCICSATPRLDLATRLILVMHFREMRKVTSTAILAMNALSHSEFRLHGKQHQRLNLDDLNDPDRRLLVLYPDPSAATLSPAFLEKDNRPVSLIVLDGTWGQAARMRKRILGLPNAEAVKLPKGPPGEWTIRKTPDPNRLSTYEAIARAYGIIESPVVQTQLETVFRLMVKRIRYTRGLGPV